MDLLLYHHFTSVLHGYMCHISIRIICNCGMSRTRLNGSRLHQFNLIFYYILVCVTDSKFFLSFAYVENNNMLKIDYLKSTQSKFRWLRCVDIIESKLKHGAAIGPRLVFTHCIFRKINCLLRDFHERVNVKTTKQCLNTKKSTRNLSQIPFYVISLYCCNIGYRSFNIVRYSNSYVFKYIIWASFILTDI